MKEGICEQCNQFGIIHKHHRDFDHNNDEESNRQTLCPYCHKQAHIDGILARNQAEREANPRIDCSKPGWSSALTWQELLDARGYPSINVSNP